jgi:hypothetical protein
MAVSTEDPGTCGYVDGHHPVTGVQREQNQREDECVSLSSSPARGPQNSGLPSFWTMELLPWALGSLTCSLGLS